MKAETLRKLLQAGALATDAMSKGSAGGLGKAIYDSKIDLSGRPNIRPQPHDQSVNIDQVKRIGKYSTDHKGRDYDDENYGKP